MTEEERKALVERLVTFEQWLYDMDLSDLSEVQPNLRDVAKQIEADGQRIAELGNRVLEWLGGYRDELSDEAIHALQAIACAALGEKT